MRSTQFNIKKKEIP